MNTIRQRLVHRGVHVHVSIKIVVLVVYSTLYVTALTINMKPTYRIKNGIQWLKQTLTIRAAAFMVKISW